MDLHYRILGSFARHSEGMARSRVNGLGLNWWIMIAIGMFTGFAGYEVYESLHNRAGARDVTVAQAVADRNLLDTFVRVTGGQLAIQHALSQGKDGDEKAKTFWVPMLDAEQKYAMYVELDDDVEREDMAGGAMRGMLRTLPIELKDHVKAQGIQVEGVRMDTGVMLVAGARPARLWLWLILSALGASVVGLMLLAALLRYVVFRAAGQTPELADDVPPVEPSAVDLRVSGKFRLSDKIRQRFLDTSAFIAEMESGDKGLLANVNASVTMYGQVTENRAGTWGILIKSGTLDPPQYGTFYSSEKPRPAMRIRFTDAAVDKRATAILSFATPAARDAVRAALYAPAIPPEAVTTSADDAAAE
jgi:hypothetical protein